MSNPKLPRDALRGKAEFNSDCMPARVRWQRADMLAAKLREQGVVAEIGSLDRPLTDAERERVLLALRNIRAITKVQRAWRGGRP